MIALAVCLVGGRYLWIWAQRPVHIQEIAAAFGSVSRIYGMPQLNHDGRKITYMATSDKGYALFLYDVAARRKQVVCEERGFGFNGDDFDIHAWPWAPDDSSFIYSLHDKLVICPADDPAKTTVQLSIGINTISDLAWLNPDLFVYSAQRKNLYCVRKHADGHWEQQRLPDNDEVSSLTAVSETEFAWLQHNYICHLDLAKYLTGTNNPFNATMPVSDAASQTNRPVNRPVLWLDSSIVQQADQTPVVRLADLSPTKNVAIVNGTPPTYNAPDSPLALHGKGTIHFTSADSIANATGLKTVLRLGITHSAPRTVFAVLRRDGGHEMMAINIGETGGHGTYFGVYDQAVGLYLPGGWDWLDNIAPPSSANWNLLEVVYDGTSQKGYVNGELKGTTTFPLDTADKEVEIGLRTGPNAAGSDGDFAELLIYNRALDEAERRKVEDYLCEKWFGTRWLTPQHPLVWFDPQVDRITGFSFSKETGQILISRTANGRDSLWRLDPSVTGPDSLTRIMKSGSIQNAQWAGGKDFAYFSGEPGHRGVVLADLSGVEHSRLFERADVRWFKVTSDEKLLLFTGVVSNTPYFGIWQYDLALGQLQPVVSCSDLPSIYASNVIPSQGWIKLPSGRSVNYTTYPPLNFDPHRKYPLVMGDHVFYADDHRRLWMPCFAACGAYVVIVGRPSWWDGIEQWEGDVTGVCQNLMRAPYIDKQRIFLVGTSAETEYLSDCLAKSPGLWKGAIFLNPGMLPDFSKSPPFQSRPKILISAGSEEGEGDRFKQFQANSLNYGVMVDYVIHPDEGHTLISDAARLERTKAMMHFVFEE